MKGKTSGNRNGWKPIGDVCGLNTDRFPTQGNERPWSDLLGMDVACRGVQCFVLGCFSSRRLSVGGSVFVIAFVPK